MGETFFSSREAAEITGCTLRQLQYWREKEVVVPTISGTGTGRSIYYSQANLVELAVMEYLLSLGLTFEIAHESLTRLREIEPRFVDPQIKRRFMLKWEEKVGKLELVEFDREGAIASLDSGQPIIPVWLDRLYQQLAQNL
ncbi:MAG: MerR family transcriptional regulator [Oscillatoria sp. PMC 1051.18]|nr:MerR family transcriptional regulator [Oscillatoria sp. PMC 1050.18]MEC5033301.1 MerR family transcriptional regulator [Oscillatoria sp. PMC 1051.18]